MPLQVPLYLWASVYTQLVFRVSHGECPSVCVRLSVSVCLSDTFSFPTNHILTLGVDGYGGLLIKKTDGKRTSWMLQPGLKHVNQAVRYHLHVLPTFQCTI